jgi:hypothetical protein
MNREAIKRAMAEVSRLLSEGEAEDLRGGGKPVMKVEMEAGEQECPECAKGTCSEPEHMAPEELDGLTEMYGEG